MATETQVLARSARDIAKRIPIQYEIFCAELANGTLAAEAAVRAGYCAEYAETLVKRPEIIERTNELVCLRDADTNGGIASRIWAECQLILIARDAMNGTPDSVDAVGNVTKGLPINRELARAAIMDLCKVKGWIVERKQVQTASLDLNKLGKGELGGKLDDLLTALAPGARAKVKAIAAGKEPSVDK